MSKKEPVNTKKVSKKPTVAHPKRHCRGCGVALSPVRYFNCDYCANLLPEYLDWADVCSSDFGGEF